MGIFESYEYADQELDINFNVHGWSQTGTLGVMYEVDKNTRFGLSYRLRSAQRAKGHFKERQNKEICHPQL